jgi:G3E family GTPase
MSAGFEGFKPSAFEALERAHAVVVNGMEDISGEEALELERRIKEYNPRAKLVMVSELGRERAWEMVLSRAAGKLGGELMSPDVEERVLQAVKEKAEEGRIPCAVALKLAEELGVPPLEVGKAANALNIKIVKCSLGCF